MVLNSQIINRIKTKSGLTFEKAKDFDILTAKIFEETGRTIGVTTIKRLLGYITDARKTNEYTLNTIAIYLSFPTWNDLCGSLRIDSDWNFKDDSIYVHDLEPDAVIQIKYLNRIVVFKVISHNGENALQVLDASNSSLQPGDILVVSKLKKGEILEAEQVFRGESIGNYRTNGELLEISVS